MVKFRSWNENFNKFYHFKDGKYYYFTTNLRGNKVIKIDCGEKIEDSNFSWQNAEQFTELKDKNGVEIFTGDKITCAGQRTLIVDWDNSTAGWCFITDEWLKLDYQMLLEDWDSVKIIGNIHEEK